MENLLRHGKLHLISGKFHAINPVRILLVGRAGILGQNCAERIPLFFRQELQKFFRDLHRKPVLFRLVREAALRIRVAVRKGDLGLDVKDRRPIHHVRPRDN